MAFNARILADSVNPVGNRLTTFELTFPRSILAEFNTHRMISRNAASSRAIPTESLIQRVVDDPFIPDFRLNKKGMQAGARLDESEAELAREMWLEDRDRAVVRARRYHALNIHKQYVNRLLEPWMWATVIASATEWANLFHLRCSPEAEPSFQRVANMAIGIYRTHEPWPLLRDEWHLPMVTDEDTGLSEKEAIKVSVGRCARIAYLTHDGKRDPDADIALHDRLAASGHWSPFEHQARAGIFIGKQWGNFTGFEQYRKTFSNENVTVLP